MIMGEAAHNHLETCWADTGRSHKGVDCIGLVISCCRDCGVDIDPNSDYNATTSPLLLTRQAGRFFTRVPHSIICTGDIIYFQSGSILFIGIYIEDLVPYIIHSVPPKGVRSSPIPAWDTVKFKGAFRLCLN